jgi:hypothetical protein
LDKHKKTCIYNEVLREDCASLARNSAIIARAINTNLVNRGPITGNSGFPPSGVCWRGGGFEETSRNFFVPGKTYRAPCFLATSFKKSVTNFFMYQAEALGKPVVQWKIRVHPQGGNSLQHRCKHVNLLRVTHVAGEEEYLFAAFSVFTVHEVAWAAKPTAQDPHCITIDAAIDNNALEAEDLPLAPWS